MVIPNPLPDYGNGRSILSKVIGGVVRLAKKVWDVVTGKDETQEEISQQKGYNPEKSQANDIAQLNNLLIEYRTNISSAGNELEREMMLEYADAVQEIMEVFDKYNSTLKIARTETIKHRFKRIGNDLKGTFSDYISQKISLDNSDFVSILRLPAGEMKNNRLQEIKQKVFIEAGNDIICKIKDAIDDFHDSVEDAFYEHLDRAEQSVTEKNKAFEKMSEVTDTDTESLENMLLQSEYIVSVCSYADDVI